MENSKWTIETYAAHNEALRKAEDKFQKERDRRYKEVQIEKEKAEALKEKARGEALALAREIQVYKDEKANELREQINAERLLYVRKEDIKALDNKFDLLLKPVIEYISGKQGSARGVDKTMYYIIAIVGLAVGLLVTFLKFN